jgi:hypothetical protein
VTHPANPLQPAPHALAIDWEDMPSLAHLVGSESRERVWDDTMPAALDMPAPSVWVHDRLPGLDIHEIHEPEIFRLFFDPARPDAHAAGR